MDKPLPWNEIAKLRMAKLGLKQADLVEPLGVSSTSAVSHYLAGNRKPEPQQLVALAIRLSMSMDDLMGMATNVDLTRIAADTILFNARSQPVHIDVVLLERCGKAVSDAGYPAANVWRAAAALYQICAGNKKSDPRQMLSEYMPMMRGGANSNAKTATTARRRNAR